MNFKKLIKINILLGLFLASVQTQAAINDLPSNIIIAGPHISVNDLDQLLQFNCVSSATEAEFLATVVPGGNPLDFESYTATLTLTNGEDQIIYEATLMNYETTSFNTRCGTMIRSGMKTGNGDQVSVTINDAFDCGFSSTTASLSLKSYPDLVCK